MFLPIGDDNPRERTPYVNTALLIANVATFLLFCLPHPSDAVLREFAMIPSELNPLTLLTSLFLHAGPSHLFGNMLFLWIFGDNVEDRFGHVGYAFFYAACGLAADLVHLSTTAHPEIPTLGASGAISGVIAAYVLFFPRARVRVLTMFGWGILRIPAFWFIGLWFAEQVFFSMQGFGGVAYGAHIGGFVGGLAVALAVRFGRRLSPAKAVPSWVSRQPFVAVDAPTEEEFLDPAEDRYSVLLLSDELPPAREVAERAAALTREPPARIAARLDATRGLVAKGLSHDDAALLQQDLHARGIGAALIAEGAANRAPRPVPVDAASWDDRVLRIRTEHQMVPLPWSAPFLWTAARVGGRGFVDLFVNRQTAFRIREEISLTRVDPRRRSEIPETLSGFARAVIDTRSGAAMNEDLRVLAGGGLHERLSFSSMADYDDYLFRIYTLTLSRLERP